MRTKLRSKVTLLFMTIAVLLAVPAVAALADTLTVSNTLITNTNATKAPGDTGTANVWLEPTNGTPAGDQNGCNASTAAGQAVTVTLTSNNADVTFPNGNTAQITDCGSNNAKQVTYNVANNASAGTAVISATATGGKTGQTNLYNTSDTLTVTINPPAKQNQTISFAANTPTTKTFGDANFNVSATATSGLTVSYAAKAGSSCTVSNAGLVSLTGAGTCTVVASQAGNASYNAAPNVEHAISVGKATPTISWDTPTAITYPTALSGTQLNATAQGVGGGSLAGSFQYNPADGTVLNAGTHQLNTTFTPTNTTDYTNANANVSLDVNQASQTINFTSTEPANAVYGDTYTPAATGGGSGNPVTFDASGDCSYSSTTGKVTMTAAGTCTVTADQAGNTNYAPAAQASQEFSVGRRPVTVTPDSDQSKVYGDTDPNLAYQVTSGSVINNDPFSGSLGRAAGNDVGTYAINLGSLSLGPNYDLSLSSTPVNFEITQRPITVKAVNVTRVYGDSTPAFTLALASGSLGHSDTLTNSFGTQVQFSPEGTTAGQHYIDVSGLSNSNYDISYATGTNRGVLTITQRPITGSFTAANKVWDGTTAATVTGRSLSGVLGNDDVSLTGGTATFNNPDVGANKPVTLTGATLSGDDAGNYSLSSVSNATASILAWTTKGFYQPVDMSTATTTVWNTVKGGSTVPLKFELLAGDTELTDPANVKSLQSTKVNCSSGTGIEDAIETTATGGTSLRYDSTGGQFIYNWKTPTGAGSCYKVTVTANDGSTISAFFKMK
jgi:hypothetical protein